MASPYDSHESEGMREIINQGFAIKRGGGREAVELAELEKVRATVRDTDVPSVQRPFAPSASTGVASTHGFIPVARESAVAAP